MAEEINIGDRVQVFLNSEFWKSEGWFDGVVVRIDPYTEHRSFIWVQLDEGAEAAYGKDRLISVLNPKNIRKV
jgi:hypothetical protein